MYGIDHLAGRKENKIKSRLDPKNLCWPAAAVCTTSKLKGFDDNPL
jgi:hypothetical protein